MIKLSVCIPTYNFADFIAETLQSIVDQMDDRIEVLIVDGASTDNTAEVVEPFVRDHPNIHYHLLEEKGGIDVDMARSVEYAQGEFCWLFSSDDIMDKQALERVFALLEDTIDLVLCSHTDCTIDMQPLQRHPVLKVDSDAYYDLGNSQQRTDYFDRAITSEPFFSFMSSLIIRRTYWNKIDINPDFIGSCWAHAARLFEINQSTPIRIQHVYEPLLHRRGDNDSFANNGLVNRYGIAIRGYNKIADRFFGADSREAWNIRRTLRNEYSLKSFLYAKHCCYTNPEREDIVVLNSLLDAFYCEGTVRHSVYKALYHLAWKTPLALLISIYQFVERMGKR